MQNKKIGILSFYYPVETSPTIKSIISYITECGYNFDLIVEHLDKEKSLDVLKSINIKQLTPVWICFLKVKLLKLLRIPLLFSNRIVNFYLKIVSRVEKRIGAKKLKKFVNDYDWVFCIEATSLITLSMTDYSLARTIYFSLECEQIFLQYEYEYVRSILTKCLFCVTQSEKRGEGLNNYFKVDLNYEYLPVSRSPIVAKQIAEKKNKNIKLIYSGYFAPWACLKEVVNAYSLLNDHENITLILQGHYPGKEDYLREIISLTKKYNRIQIDTNFYNDEEHFEYLSNCNIGIAFYKSPTDGPNWENMLFSSGKIANYLWAGLGILTNIKDPALSQPPFLYIEDITHQNIQQCVEFYKENMHLFQKEAYKFANKYYNSYKFLDVILKKVENELEN